MHTDFHHDRHHDHDLHVAIDPDSIIDHDYMFGFLAIVANRVNNCVDCDHFANHANNFAVDLSRGNEMSLENALGLIPSPDFDFG